MPLLAAATHSIDHTQVEGGEVVSGNAEAWLEATNVTLVEALASYDRAAVHDTPEQLVEGHTVFTVIEIPVVRNVTNWTLEIVGDVDCRTNTSTRGVYFLGLPVPTRVDRARVECSAGGRMYATPDPFYDSNNTFRSALQPTGNVIGFQAPSGDLSFIEEYTFTTVRPGEDGEPIQERWWAWSTPLLSPWVHDDGQTVSWAMPLPADKVAKMGVREWTVYHESDPRLEGALPR